MPLWRFDASGSVRTASHTYSLMCARLVHIFWPLMTQLVAVGHRGGLQRREVGAGARLGVADRDAQIAREDLRHDLAAMVVVAVLRQRGADRLRGEERERETRAHHLLDEDELLERRHAAPAELLRPAQADPAVAAHLAHRRLPQRTAALAGALLELRVQLGRDQRLEIGAQFLAQALLFGGELDFHPHLSWDRAPRCSGGGCAVHAAAARYTSASAKKHQRTLTIALTGARCGCWRGAAGCILRARSGAAIRPAPHPPAKQPGRARQGCRRGEHCMTAKPKVAALEGWFTLDEQAPQLLGSRCKACGTVYFPKQTSLLPQPGLRRHRVRGGAAVAPRPRVVLHQRLLPAAGALRRARSLRAVHDRGRRARGRAHGGARPGRGRRRGRPTSRSAWRWSWCSTRSTRTTRRRR